MKLPDNQTSAGRAGPGVRAASARGHGSDTRSGPASNRRAGFSLIEMIGVLAIMAILASIVVPNALKSLDRAAVKAEIENMDRLGDQLRVYLRLHGVLPTTVIPPPPTIPQWATDLATAADLSPADVWTNKRVNNRVYVVDPAPPGTERAMLLSSMRSGLGLPPATTINAADFDQIWRAADGLVPPVTSWAGWANWNAQQALDYLVIERVNLQSEYLLVVLNNLSTTATVSYQVLHPDGVTVNGNLQPPPPAPPGPWPWQANLTLLAGDRLNLFTQPGSVLGLNYSYVVSTTGKTFDFEDATPPARWTPK